MTQILGSFMSQCDETGVCQCKDGVIGEKCNNCAENHYDITAGCKKCDDCYDMVILKSTFFIFITPHPIFLTVRISKIVKKGGKHNFFENC